LEGSPIIGIDRGKAWRFFVETPIEEIAKVTGESPYLEKGIVQSAMVLGPIALLTSVGLSFAALGWMGLVCLVFFPLAYLVYGVYSARGGSRLFGITVLLLISTSVHNYGNLGHSWMTAAITFFLLSLWCIRFVFCSSTFFLRAFIVRNSNARAWLSDWIVIVHDYKQ
jgi:hypothetical protein